MKKKYFILLFLITSIANSQYYTSINQTAIQQNQKLTNINNNTNITVNDYSVGLSMIANEMSAFRNSWENKKKREETHLIAQSQINLVKSNYSSSEHYPQKIIDGWHSIIATDNYNYCSPAKVFIKGNAIKEFVVGNWITLSSPFLQLSAIAKGKCLLNLDVNNNKDALEIYFMNDLEEPTIVDKPLDSGSVFFYSNLSTSIEIKFYDNKPDPLKKTYQKSIKLTTDNNSKGKSSLTIGPLKPGTYFYTASGYRGLGIINWEGYLEVRENYSLEIDLNKDNKKQ